MGATLIEIGPRGGHYGCALRLDLRTRFDVYAPQQSVPGASEDSAMEVFASPQGTAADQRQPPLPPRMNQRAASRALVATSLLLGCAGSLRSAQAAGATASSGAPSLSRRYGESVLRRSVGSPRKDGKEYHGLLAVAGPQRRGLPRLSSPWVVVQTTRGGAFRRRGASGPGAVPAAGSGASGDKGDDEGGASEGVVSAEAGGGSDGDTRGEAASEKGSGEVSLRNGWRSWL